jgi:hypothetical protein
MNYDELTIWGTPQKNHQPVFIHPGLDFPDMGRLEWCYKRCLGWAKANSLNMQSDNLDFSTANAR